MHRHIDPPQQTPRDTYLYKYMGSSEDYNVSRSSNEMADYPHGVPPPIDALAPGDVRASTTSTRTSLQLHPARLYVITQIDD